MFFGGQPQWIQLAIAIGMGCLGAMLALFAQRLAFAIGGFFAGVFLALKVCQSLGVTGHGTTLLLLLGAGLIGGVVATLVMDIAITILACLVGAAAIVGELHLSPALNFVVFILLAGAGFLVQEKRRLHRKDE